VRLTAAFAAHELRTQGRSLRFRVLAALYVALGSAPAALIWLRREQADSAVGAATYAAETLEVLPVLAAVVAFLISLDAITREQDEGAWSVVSLAGMSSAGYLLRRWLAIQILLVPLTAVPLAVAAALAAAGTGSLPAAGPFVGPWLLHVAPLALVYSAQGLAVGTIAGGALNAFLLAGLVLPFLPVLVDGVLGRFGIRLGSPTDWLDMGHLLRSASRIASRGRQEKFLAPAFPMVVSETPYDLRAVAGPLLARAAVPVAQATALLALAVRYLRRTRPDVRPWRIRPDHPLRTFLVTLARLRERYTPDPKPVRVDLLAIAALLLLATGSSALLLRHVRRYDELGRARFAAEDSRGPATTPGDLLPGRWRIEGTLGPDRSVSLTVTAEMRNAGDAPRGHLAFELNPGLRVLSALPTAGTAVSFRSWDRLAMDLTPPIPPGGRREIRFRLAGAPASLWIDPQIFEYPAFHKKFGDHLYPRFDRDLLDLTTSYRAPALSARRVQLVSSDLSPIPRYQPWTLDDESRVLAESFTPQAEITLALAGPAGILLADSCGDTTRSGRLAGGCRLPLAELAVVGGRYTALPDAEGGTTVAVYPPHARIGALHLGFLNGSTAKVEEAWPGMNGLGRVAVLEWSGDRLFDADPIGVALSTQWRGESEDPFSVLGNLVLLSEGDLILKAATLRPDRFLAELIAAQLSRRRPLAREDSTLFRVLFRTLALQRMGLGTEGGATVTGLRPGQGGAVSVPPPTDGYSPLYWHNRFPALLVGLRHRMGEEALRQAIEDFLAHGDDRHPGNRQELLAALARHGGPDLPRFLEDNLVKGGLAEPVLEGVEFHPTANGWRATGRMHNRGDAEALCTIVLTTDLGPVSTLARADGGKDGAFELHTSRRPQAVLLDPDKECHRLVPNGVPGDRVFFQGGK
jgi:hypothetical protein